MARISCPDDILDDYCYPGVRNKFEIYTKIQDLPHGLDAGGAVGRVAASFTQKALDFENKPFTSAPDLLYLCCLIFPVFTCPRLANRSLNASR